MNSDPLQRRMFAQQILAQHARANQPMGILASSPQLMGAVQGFKDGGAVKGYNLGGIGGSKSVLDAAGLDKLNKGAVNAPPSLIESKYANVYFDPKDRKYKFIDLPAETAAEIPVTKEQKDEKQIKTEGEFGTKKEAPEVTATDDFSGDTSATFDRAGGGEESGQPKVSEKSMIQEPGAVINETNAKLTQTNKELKDNIPEGKNLGARSDTSEIDAKIQAASTSYEGFKKKLATTDKRYEADEAKRTNYMKKIEDIMETEDDEISLDDVDKKAREVLGLKKGEYDDDRVTAFWMSMIKGGLATAAGESGNALTNIAKGLMFGVDSYGKDMNNITLQEREDRQNLAKMKYNLMKDENAAKVAERTLKIQAYGELAKLEENKFQFKTEQEYKVARNEVLDNLAMAKLDLTSMQVLNAMKMGNKNYDAKIREISLNEAKQKDYVRLTEKQLSMQLRDKASTKEIKNIFALGSDYATYEDGEFTFTKKGRAMLIASTASKIKFTDLVTSAKAAGKNKTIEGYKYGTSEQAEDAYYYYVGVTKPKLEALVKTTKGNLGTIDNEEYRKQEKAILKQFAKDTGGVLEGDGGTGFVEDKIYTDKNGVKKRYKNGQFVDP